MPRIILIVLNLVLVLAVGWLLIGILAEPEADEFGGGAGIDLKPTVWFGDATENRTLQMSGARPSGREPVEQASPAQAEEAVSVPAVTVELTPGARALLDRAKAELALREVESAAGEGSTGGASRPRDGLRRAQLEVGLTGAQQSADMLSQLYDTLGND